MKRHLISTILDLVEFCCYLEAFSYQLTFTSAFRETLSLTFSLVGAQL
jgi:hypothetical protein